MAVGKGSIKRAAKAVDAAVVAAPAQEVVESIVEKAPAEKAPAAKKPAAKKAPAKKTAAKKPAAKKTPEKKEEPKNNGSVGIGTEMPTYLL